MKSISSLVFGHERYSLDLELFDSTSRSSVPWIV